MYNVGGGADNAISLRQLLAYLEARAGVPLDLSYHPWRPGDQRVFVSDIRRSEAELGWRPRVSWTRGVDQLSDWIAGNMDLFA